MTDEDLDARVADLEERVEYLERAIQREPPTPEDESGLPEFVDELDMATHAERTLAIAYHLQELQGMHTFTTADIMEAYSTCEIPLAANFSDVLATCEERGWVMRAGKKGSVQLRMLTTDGIQYVEDRLPEE